MADYAVEGAELKRLIKVARKGPIAFGFNPGKTEDDTYFGMDRKKQPAILGKAAREGGDGNKFSFGTAVVEGKVMRLTCLRELPNMAKRLKKFLKSQKVMLNVELLDESGNLIESDIEDGLPDDPDLDGEVDEDPVTEDAPAGGAEPTAAEAAAPPPTPNMAEISKRLAAIAARIKALPPEAAAKITKPFQNVVALARAGDVDGAASGADKLEAALKMLEGATAGQTPAAPPPAPPPPDPQMLKLMQHVAAMRSKADSIGDADRKASFMAALDKVTGLIQAQEAEKAVAILKKLQEMLKALAAAPKPAETTAPETDTPNSAPEPDAPDIGGETDPEPDNTTADTGAEADWQAAFKRLEPLVNEAMTKGLVLDVEALRKQWQWAVTNAGDLNFAKAMEALPPVEKMLLDAPDDGLTAFERDIGPSARAVAAARVKWMGVRGKMTGEVQRLASQMISVLAEEEDLLEEVSAEINGMTNRLATFNEQLEDELDLVVNCPPANQGDLPGLKAAARKTLQIYRTELESPFFQDLDQGNGFGTIAVTTPALAALDEIAAALN